MDATTAKSIDTLKFELTREANAAHVQYPQYKGHWDGWSVGIVRRNLRTKLGLAFAKGDTVLINDEPRCLEPNGRFVIAYSWRNRCDTSIRKADIEVIG